MHSPFTYTTDIMFHKVVYKHHSDEVVNKFIPDIIQQSVSESTKFYRGYDANISLEHFMSNILGSVRIIEPHNGTKWCSPCLKRQVSGYYEFSNCRTGQTGIGRARADTPRAPPPDWGNLTGVKGPHMAVKSPI